MPSIYKKYLKTQEISWLSYNARILQEANDPTVPLKMRIRFLGIYSNNRDEFFRVQVAMLQRMIKYNKNNNKKYLGKNPQRVLDRIHHITLEQQKDFNSIWKKILDELKNEKVFLINDRKLNAKQKTFVRNFFDQDVRSSIIPIFIENLEQLPSFRDSSIFLGIVLHKSNGSRDKKFAMIEIPTKQFSRFVSLPGARGVQNIMLLEDVIHFNLPRIFSNLGYTHLEGHMFKVTKDAEINLDNALATTFIQKIEKGIKNRAKAPAIRLLYDNRMNPQLVKLLTHKLNLSHEDNIIPGGYIRNFRDFMDFPANLPASHSRPPPFTHPALAKSTSVYDVIKKRDVLLHVPFHSFNSIIDMLREAAMDPDVQSIKITAYRLAPNSKVCNALINAVRNGKQVHVVIELRASFDEETNLAWKSKLEDEGVKVFIGIPNMKVHAKICVIKKQVGNKTEHYGFVGTGNLNEKTALTYIDHFLLTSDRDIMADVIQVFGALESPESNWKHKLGLCKTLLVTPSNMRKAFLSKINREIKSAKGGLPSHIITNVNALSDDKLIKKLHKASAAGVPIHLIVRGIICGAFDHNENDKKSTAISIVDEFLEHSRISLFHNAGDEEIYISSADWMVRNLDYRIEIAVPIKDKALKDELKHVLKIKLSDNVKARVLDEDLSNHFVSTPGRKIRSQEAIYHYLKRKKGWP